MADLFPITLADQIAEVEREIAMRQQVYGRRVAAGQMTKDKADKQIALMEAVRGTLKGLK